MSSYISRFRDYLNNGESRGFLAAGIGVLAIWMYAPEKKEYDPGQEAAIVDKDLCNEIRITLRMDRLDNLLD